MSTHFNTYPVVAGMGLREAINAMLDHVAWGSSMGYRADTYHASNYRAILRDFGPGGDYGTEGLVEEVYDHMTDGLRLVKHIPGTYPGKLPGQAGHLGHLVETLLELCNDYPVYDETDHSNLVAERTIEAIEQERQDDDPTADDILTAMYDLGIYVEHESDGSVYFTVDDFTAAVGHAQSLAHAKTGV
jgi:hypothetical protein